MTEAARTWEFTTPSISHAYLVVSKPMAEGSPLPDLAAQLGSQGTKEYTLQRYADASETTKPPQGRGSERRKRKNTQREKKKATRMQKPQKLPSDSVTS